jgi:hypothetical protein
MGENAFEDIHFIYPNIAFIKIALKVLLILPLGTKLFLSVSLHQPSIKNLLRHKEIKIFHSSTLHSQDSRMKRCFYCLLFKKKASMHMLGEP